MKLDVREGVCRMDSSVYKKTITKRKRSIVDSPRDGRLKDAVKSEKPVLSWVLVVDGAVVVVDRLSCTIESKMKAEREKKSSGRVLLLNFLDLLVLILSI